MADERSTKGVLADPPYNQEWAQHYAMNGSLPTPNNIVKYSVEHLLPIDGRVGVLSMEWQRYPKHKVKEVAVAAVYVGNGNIGRTFAAFEKIAERVGPLPQKISRAPGIRFRCSFTRDGFRERPNLST